MHYRNIIGALLAVCILMSISSLVYAAEAKIQGKVIDQDGNPIAGAKITLRDNRGRMFVAKTKKDGRYYKRGIPPGTYEFTVEAKGYRTRTFTLTLRAGAVERNDIPLVPATAEDIGGEDYVTAIEHFKNKEYQQAAALMEKVIEREPDLGPAYYNLGLIYLAMEQNEKAIQVLERSIELIPDHIDLYTILGKTYLATENTENTENTERALELFNKAVEIKPDAKTYFDIGAVFFNNDNKKEAVQNFEKAIEIDPEFPMAYYFLGILYFGEEKFDESLASLNKYIELEPNAPNIDDVKEIITRIESLKKSEQE